MSFHPSTPAVDSVSIGAVIDTHSVVAIHFWAEWNRVDSMMDRRIQEIQNRRLCDKVHFVSCDIDDPLCLEVCKEYSVANIPFLALVVDRKQRKGIMGLHEADELVVKIEKQMAISFRDPTLAQKIRGFLFR